MTPKIIDVAALADYNVLITYENSEKRILSLVPFFEAGLFFELKNEELFKTVKVSFDTIEWDNGIDIDPEDVYERSKKQQSASIA